MTTPTNQMLQAMAQVVFCYRDDNLFWRTRARGRKLSVPAGCINGNGYMQVNHRKRSYKVHNVIWNYHYGHIPEGYSVDHIDRNPLNNALGNLRLATPREQTLNQSLSLPSSGYNNIYQNKLRWRVCFWLHGRRQELGNFITLDEAIVARDAWLLQNHKS